MTNKVYRTAQGKIVDMGAIALQNEQVRAVGNMGVNARGDQIDANGNAIKTANERVNRQYQKQTNVQSGPLTKPKAEPVKEKLVADEVVAPLVVEPVEEVVFPEDFEDDFVKEEVAVPVEEVKKTGLAGALAKAKKD